jgi:pimeloyl-ACP methyl ester carboxylesterase
MRFIMFPGLAADARMYELQRRDFPFLETPDWIAPERGETIESYCERLAEDLKVGQEPTVVGGVSFGGMVAQVLAPRINAVATVLISTWCPGDPHPPGGAAMMRVANHLPIPWLQWFFQRDVLVERFEPIDEKTKQLLIDMMEDCNWEFVRWALGAMGRFKTRPDQKNVQRIHGTVDKVLPQPHDDESCILVDGAGHAMSATHHEKVNRFIQQCLDSFITT